MVFLSKCAIGSTPTAGRDRNPLGSGDKDLDDKRIKKATLFFPFGGFRGWIIPTLKWVINLHGLQAQS